MQSGSKAEFDAQYQLLLQQLTLKGLHPKTSLLIRALCAVSVGSLV